MFKHSAPRPQISSPAHSSTSASGLFEGFLVLFLNVWLLAVVLRQKAEDLKNTGHPDFRNKNKGRAEDKRVGKRVNELFLPSLSLYP